jgi:hypothetical protein
MPFAQATFSGRPMMANGGLSGIHSILIVEAAIDAAFGKDREPPQDAAR